MAEAVGRVLGCAATEVLVCSTGVIGVPMPMDRVVPGIERAAGDLTSDGHRAARAIMTTDLVPKEAAVTAHGVTVAGIAKGSGMIHPDMATMLAFVAAGTVRLAADVSELPEYDLRAVDGRQHLIALSDRFGKLTVLFRNGMTRADEIGDKVTSDVLSQMVAEIEKDLWFLESHLAG